MGHNDSEPLEPGIWLMQLKKLAALSPEGEAELAMALRRAFHLVELAPRPLRHLVACNVSEIEFEQLLDSGALLPATVALVGSGLGHGVTPMPDGGGFEAEVWFPSDPSFCQATGSSAPFALFSAWLECLLTLHQPDELGEAWARCPDRRISQFGRRPKLTEH